MALLKRIKSKIDGNPSITDNEIIEVILQETPSIRPVDIRIAKEILQASIDCCRGKKFNNSKNK